jgi:hypothetical protein
MPAFVRLKQEDYEMEALTLKKVLFLKKKKKIQNMYVKNILGQSPTLGVPTFQV